MLKIVFRNAVLAVLVAMPVVTHTQARTQTRGDIRQHLIVSCSRPCTAVAAAVDRIGGRVTRRFANLDAVAVEVPLTRLPDLVAVAGPAAVQKDGRSAIPRPARSVGLARGQKVAPGQPATSLGSTAVASPSFDPFGGAKALHAAGKIGRDVIVAVIDGGIFGGPMTPIRSEEGLLYGAGVGTPISGVSAWRTMLGDALLGGESVVPPDVDPLSATHLENNAHGTQIAVLIAGRGELAVPNDAAFLQSMQTHLPGDVLPCPGAPYEAPCGPNTSLVPMVGTAPGAKLYALKAFAAGSPTAPTSLLMAALDRAITLRRNYNRGVTSVPVAGDGSPENPFVYDSLRIDVVSMSFGMLTFFAGRDLFDQLVLQALEVGIVPVVSAGNEGPAAMTNGSPGTSFGALTVGAASPAPHDRVWGDMDFGLGAGLLLRPSSHLQTATFSSRGPTADGRLDPDVMAHGDGNLVIAPLGVTEDGEVADCRALLAIPGSCQLTVSIDAGTSFAAPIVAGAAALLRREVPQATAVQIRNALHMSADPRPFGNRSSPIDRGAGYIDVPRALALLQSGRVSRTLPDIEEHRVRSGEDLADELGRGGRSVIRNVTEAGFNPVTFHDDRYVQRVTSLVQGQAAQFFIPSPPGTARFTVEISDIESDLPPDQHNTLVGENVLVQLVDAGTSTNGADIGWEFAWERVPVGQPRWRRVVDSPQTGLLRLALLGDRPNAGGVAATVTIRRERNPNPLPAVTGAIRQDDFLWFDVDIPRGTRALTVEAAWTQNWGRYPTNDLDLFVIDPSGAISPDGFTWNSPERATVARPIPGRWRIVLNGFQIHRPDGRVDDPDKRRGRVDAFTLSVTADGKRLKAQPCPSCELP